MRALICSALAITLALSLQPAAAQSADDMMVGMETAQAEAQAQAARPGDEELSCDQLGAEMGATMQDPAVQAQMTSMGAWSQGQMETLNAARGRMVGQMATGFFIGLASSFIPGAGYAQMAAQRAMAAGQEAQAEQNMANMMQMGEGMATIMPQLMRGQRLYELGQAKQCPFLQETPPQE